MTFKDVDECEEEIHHCNSDTEVCINSVGAYDCRLVGSGSVCDIGFAVNLQTGECDGMSRTDSSIQTR